MAKNWLLSPGTSSQCEGYSSKWLIGLVCRESLLIVVGNLLHNTHVLFYHALAYCSSVLFDKESGVLKFLRDSATLEEVLIIHSASGCHSIIIIAMTAYSNE